MGDGALDKIKETYTQLTCPKQVAVEPEVQAQFANVTWVQKKDKKGNPLLYAQINTSSGKKDYDKYVFNILFYKAQIKVLSDKLAPVTAAITRYESEVQAIDTFITQQEAAYRRLEISVLTAREAAEHVADSHKQGLGNVYEEDELEEVENRRARDSAATAVPELPPKATIYKKQHVNIDDPTKGAQTYEDIRDLKLAYLSKIDELESGQLDPIKTRLICNQSQLEAAEAAYKEYMKYLNKK